ncbi:hypothetical protein RhiJN_13666 [Ceratobasidium sp. AG-Ba]|nr:hypothetical protein RhiJN_13666 [Ceratobasidium sp. AG-Ba]QRW06963.1 hypothetical protein RhiLY_05962 [Ceratobasidium sp. AG-Ba]QRW07831.1 hypothetical protein RhiLY_06830 [Ceratobasidium sp. AG-Ba]QRW14222.1 hypothetical protein RhiLY_13221 [Ceratobasidium sp. AG-Ba]
MASHVVKDMELQLFIREACKFPDKLYQTIQRAIQMDALGPTEEWNRLMDEVSSVPLGSEPRLYAPLITLYDWIRQQLGNLSGFTSTTDLHFKDTSCTPLLGSRAVRKPDMTGTLGSTADRTPDWRDVLVCWEVKHSAKRQADEEPDGRQKKKTRTNSSGLLNTSTPSHTTCLGRGLDSSDGRTSVSVLSDDHNGISSEPLAQLMSYCLEMATAQAHRRHTIGVLLCEWRLQLVLHTRAFIVVSEAFDIRHDRLKLTTAIAALWMANLETLGFDSHFVNNAEQLTVRSDGCRVTVENDTYVIEKTLFRARNLFGRATGAFAASSSSGRVVIKINCPPTSREVEANFLKAAQGIPNIIRIIAAANWGDILKSFGADFTEAVQRFELREFRVVVLSPVCEPLTRVTDLEKFKVCFRKLVQAHRRLYDIGILHCDISVGNMMYDPLGQEPYLIDGDLGKSVKNLDSPSSDHRTGTLPFMAIDLLVAKPPKHMYRHDLESFFYVLIWICAPDHSGWETVDSIPEMLEKKQAFFAPGQSRPVDSLVLHEYFEPMRLTWILSLYRIILRGRAAIDPDIGKPNADFETMGGYLTFDTFMEELQN